MKAVAWAIVTLALWALGAGFGYSYGVQDGIKVAMTAPVVKHVYVKALTKKEIRLALQKEKKGE